jgi:hypothetical protein
MNITNERYLSPGRKGGRINELCHVERSSHRIPIDISQSKYTRINTSNGVGGTGNIVKTTVPDPQDGVPNAHIDRGRSVRNARQVNLDHLASGRRGRGCYAYER